MKKPHQALVRYGAVPEVTYFGIRTAETMNRGTSVVVQTSRGEEIGELLQDVDQADSPASEEEIAAVDLLLIRKATDEDIRKNLAMKNRLSSEYSLWEKRIRDWGLDLVLIDLELTLDEKATILYVLNGRGSDCTMLAIKAAASGMGNIHVQPVDENGEVQVLPSSGGGCCSSGGSCGCAE